MMKRNSKFEIRLNLHFSAVADEDNLDETFQRVLEIIDFEQSKPIVWIPSKENI